MVHGVRRVEPGPYELLVGASSEDIRLRATIELDGTPTTPRPVLELGLNAVDFDEQRGAEIVDRTKLSGDAVTPAHGNDGTDGTHGSTAELVYRGCDFGPATGTGTVTVEVSGEGSLELALDGGPVIARLDVPATQGPYDYTTVVTPFSATGVHDLHIGLRGPVRLAHVGFSG